MSKVTFVVEFEDGKEPAVHSCMDILGGKLRAVSWKDALESSAVSVADGLPDANQTVLLFDAGGEGWLIGWRSVWYGVGQVETGEWQWTLQIGEVDDLNITHWAEIPEDPEAAK